MDELLEEDISLSLSPSLRGNRFVVSIGFKNRLVEAIVVRNRIIPKDGITSKISPLFLFFSRPNTLLRRPFISIFRESVHINRKRKNKLVSKKPRIHPGNTTCTTDKRGIQRGEGGEWHSSLRWKGSVRRHERRHSNGSGVQPGRSSADIDSIRSPSITRTYSRKHADWKNATINLIDRRE